MWNWVTEQFSCTTVYYSVQDGFNFWVCGWNPIVRHFIIKKASEQYFTVVQQFFEQMPKLVKIDFYKEFSFKLA